jgi:hypothetical protein
MPPDDERLRPVRHQAGHVLADDRLAEDCAIQDVAQRAVRAAIHPLQAKLLHPRLVRRDGGAFCPDAVLGDGVRRIDRHLVVGLITVLDAQVTVRKVDVEVRQNPVRDGGKTAVTLAVWDV